MKKLRKYKVELSCCLLLAVLSLQQFGVGKSGSCLDNESPFSCFYSLSVQVFPTGIHPAMPVPWPNDDLTEDLVVIPTTLPPTLVCTQSYYLPSRYTPPSHKSVPLFLLLQSFLN